MLSLVIHEDEYGWLKTASRQLPEWREDVRDVYLRWAITVNAMHVAAKHYEQHAELGLKTWTVRANREGAGRDVVLETWSSVDTARNYSLSTPLVAAYALVDLFGLLEEIVFELYLIFLDENPESLISGAEFRPLRILRRNRVNSAQAAAEWEAAWASRLSAWRHKKAYDGLNRVFAAFMNESGLKRPSFHKMLDVADWARTIEAIGEARNLITHGVGTVSERLGALSAGLKNDIFLFKESEPLEIVFRHVSFVEFFLDGLLSALSISIMEKAHGPMPEPKL